MSSRREPRAGDRPMTRLKYYLKRIVLVLVSLVLALGLVEVILRVVDYQYTPLRIQVLQNWSEWRYYHSFKDEHFVYDPYLIWRPKKGYSVFNSQGYRGEEVSA